MLLRAGGTCCVLPMAEVEETMRPLPTTPFAEAPAFVVGAAVVRGRPTPIVDLQAVLGGEPSTRPQRLVLLRLAGERRVGLLVSAVAGLVAGDLAPAGEAPPLLAGAAAATIERLGSLDGALLASLSLARLVPEALFVELARQAEGSG